DTVTTAQIAQEAGISEAIIYRHFKSKKELFLACFKEGISDYLIERYRRIWRKHRQTPSAYLRFVGLEYYRFVSERPKRARFLALMLTAAYDPDISKVLKDFLEINLQAVERAYKLIFEQSLSPPPIKPRQAAWLFVGHYYTLVAQKELFPKDFRKKNVEEMLTFSFSRLG
ncbi:MAG: TetR/AcrR family transcriptional regulator, partial [Syntrophales bacterium]